MWLHIPNQPACLTSAPVSVDSHSDSDWLFPALERFATWSEWLDAGGAPPPICRASPGFARGLDRLHLLGNGVVPQQAAAAFAELWRRIEDQA
jgi:hypothetical protein